MRTIKFRGKTTNGEWVYGHYTQGSFFHPASEEETVRHIIHADMLYDVDPDTVGQFTGLYDKGGKEIYEGDILLFHGEVKRVVGYEDSHMASFSLLSPYDLGFISTFGTGSFEPFYCEVIGNIHDNPELLKGGDNETPLRRMSPI